MKKVNKEIRSVYIKLLDEYEAVGIGGKLSRNEFPNLIVTKGMLEVLKNRLRQLNKITR